MGKRFKEIYIIAIIFVLAFSLRLVYLNEIKTSPLFYPPSSGLDDSLYHRWAKSIAHGDLLGQGAFNAMPLYPYFLGSIYKLFGPNILIAKIIQFILGSFSCLLIYFIARKIFGRPIATISALLACLYGPFIFYEEILVAASLTTFLYLLTFLALLGALQSPSSRRFFLFGLLAGISALAKANILLFIPVAFILVFLKYRPIRKTLTFVCSVGLGLFLAISPFTLRNYLVCRDFIPIVTHAGLNFYIGNNEDARGTFRTPRQLGAGQQDLLANSKVVAEKIKGAALKPSQVSKFWFSQGMNFIKINPRQFVYLLGRKLLLFINFYEIPDVRDYGFAKLHFPVLKILLSFSLVFPLSILGLILSKGENRQVSLIKLFVLVYVISAILFFVNSRYRLPCLPFLIILAGAGIYRYVVCWRKAAYKKALLCLLPLIIVVGLGNMQLVRREDFSGSYNLIGQYHLERGAYQKALAQFKKAIEIDPQMDIAYYNMGKAFMESGQTKSALESLNQALEINPYLYAAYNDRGMIHLSKNELDEAYAQFAKAVQLNPYYAQAHSNLGLIFKHKGLWDSAIKKYNQALELDADLAAEIYNNIGLVYFAKGELDEAIAYFQKGIKLKPHLAYNYYNLGLVLVKKGMLAQAKKQWEKTVELDSGFADARERLNKLKEMGY